MRQPLSLALFSALLIASSLLPTATRADDPPAAEQPALPRLQRVAIGDTGAAAYLPGVPEWRTTQSEDGAQIVNGTVVLGDIGAGVVAVRFKTPLNDQDDAARERLLIAFLDHLADHVVELTERAPPGRGQTLASHPSAIGVLSIGRDAEGTEVWMKGWIDPGGIGVSWVFGTPMPAISWTEAVLQGFRFPGD